jgi:hypothetical protein
MKTETAAILAFRKEFQELCEKHQIEGILIGLRPEIKKIDGEEGKSAIPAFLDFNVNNVTANKLTTIMKLHMELGDELSDRGKEFAFKLIDRIEEQIDLNFGAAGKNAAE